MLSCGVNVLMVLGGVVSVWCMVVLIVLCSVMMMCCLVSWLSGMVFSVVDVWFLI